VMERVGFCCEAAAILMVSAAKLTWMYMLGLVRTKLIFSVFVHMKKTGASTVDLQGDTRKRWSLNTEMFEARSLQWNVEDYLLLCRLCSFIEQYV